MVQHFTTLDGVNLNGTSLSIGSFDGVHVGHQQLIRKLNKSAHQAGEKSVILTFHPHPAVILRGRVGAFYLTTPSEKVELLDELGVDIVITHPFTYELSQIAAREYVEYLIMHLGFRELWVGQDFALGKGREGDVPYLQMLGEEAGFTVNIVEPVKADGRVVSSSLIRNLISEGKVHEVIRLLDRPYQLTGPVIHGDGRGKRIGIPTANIDTGPEKLIPGAGVYACLAHVSDKTLPAAVNVGTRPTFISADKKSHVEAYILNYSGDLYNQQLSIDFVERLRGEERFDSVAQLIDQIDADIKQTQEIIARINNP